MPVHALSPMTPSESLPTLLEHLATMARADFACVYRYLADFDELIAVAAFPNQPCAAAEIATRQAIEAGQSPYWVSLAPSAQPPPLRSGKVILLRIEQEIIGALGLFSTQPSYQSPDTAEPWILWAQSIVENEYWRENQSIAATIVNMARLFGNTPSPQELVNILGTELAGPHIWYCALLLYGPMREDRPYGPFPYLEIQGTWSRQFGSGIALGLRIYLDQYPDLLAELQHRKVWYIMDVRSIEARLDPLIRGFLKLSQIHSILLLQLEVGDRPIGLLAIGAEKQHDINASEIRHYTAVSEFLAMTALQRLLQQQHDFVQRARATLLDAVSDGVLMILPDSTQMSGGEGSHAQVLTVNTCFSATFNVTPARAQGLSLKQLLHRMQLPEDVRKDLARRWFSIPVRDPSRQRGEFTMMHPKGHPANIEWTSAPVYQDKRVMGRIYTFHDASAERSATHLRSDFISRLSHELRTPLTSIKGFAQLLLEQAEAALSPDLRNYSRIIFDNAEHLNQLFSTVIEITRADTGDIKLSLMPTRLSDVVQQVANFYLTRCQAHQVRIELNLPTTLPAVRIDSNRVAQAIAQLIDNALKHTPPESIIYVAARFIGDAAELPPGAPVDALVPSILVSVKDEGVGLLPEEVENVFLPFYRTREARINKREGAGLGLTLARSFIQLHQGNIWAESRRKGGGIFFFTLPAVIE